LKAIPFMNLPRKEKTADALARRQDEEKEEPAKNTQPISVFVEERKAPQTRDARQKRKKKRGGPLFPWRLLGKQVPEITRGKGHAPRYKPEH